MTTKKFNNCYYSISPDDELIDDYELVLPESIISVAADILSYIADKKDRRIMTVCTSDYIYMSSNQIIIRMKISADDIGHIPFSRELIEISCKNKADKLCIIDMFSAVYSNSKGSYYLEIDSKRDFRPRYGIGGTALADMYSRMLKSFIPNESINAIESIPESCYTADKSAVFRYKDYTLQLIQDGKIKISPYAFNVSYNKRLENLAFHVPVLNLMRNYKLSLIGKAENMCHYISDDNLIDMIYTNHILV